MYLCEYNKNYTTDAKLCVCECVCLLLLQAKMTGRIRFKFGKYVNRNLNPYAI